MLAPQVQFQLFGRPSWLAGLGTLKGGRSAGGLAGPIASSTLAYSVDVLAKTSIGSDLLENKSPDRQLLSVGHSVSLPGVEVHSTPMEKPVADFFCSETDNADVL